MLPHTRGTQPDAARRSGSRLICDARLVAVAAGQHDAGVVGASRSSSGPDRAVELGVHQHHVLAVLDRHHRDRGAVLDVAGRLDEALEQLATRTAPAGRR